MVQYIIIVILALLISAYYYLRTYPEQSKGRRLLLGGLRALSVGILLLLLISPVLYRIIHKPQVSEVLVLRDNSSSMNLMTGNQTKSALLQPFTDELSSRFKAAGYKPVSYDFADGLKGKADKTVLNPVLAELAQKHDLSRVKAIILSSDGWLRDESFEAVRKSGIPFYVIADTSSATAVDLAITGVQNNRYTYRNEPTIIRADLKSTGYSGPATAILKLSGKALARQSLNLKADQAASVEFTQRFSQTGLFPYSVDLEAPGAKERSLNNNSYPGAIEVLSDKEQILIFTDSPGWDGKFIQDVITTNARWEAKTFLIRGGQLYQGEKVASLPNTANLAAIVVVNHGKLELPQTVADFILTNHRKGTGLLYQGYPLAALQAALPTRASNISAPYSGFLVWTPAADSYPMLATDSASRDEIPPLDYYYVTAAPGSQVLVELNNPQRSPAIVINTATGGKAVSFSFLNFWKWQLQSKNDGYGKLMTNVLTWLSNRNAGNYRAIYKPSYFKGEEIKLDLRVDDDIRGSRLDLDPILKVRDDKGKEVFSDYMLPDDANYSLKLNLDKAGNYSFEISDKVSRDKTGGRFNLADASIEARDFDFNLPLLSWIASSSGGRLLALNSDYQPLPAQKQEITQTLELPLYRKWYILSLFILAFSLELFLRRRWGLL